MALSPQLAPPAPFAPPSLPAAGQGTPAPAPPRPAPESVELPDYDPTISFSNNDARDEFGRKLTDKIALANSQMADRHDQIRQFRDQYAATSYPKDTPWPNAANLNIPTTWSAVETMHADLVGAMTGTTPLFRLRPYSNEDAQRIVNIQHLLQWQMTEQIEIAKFFDEATKAALLDGNAIGLVDWRREQHRTRKPGYARDSQNNVILKSDGQPLRALVEETDFTINQPRVTALDILDFVLYPARSLTIDSAIGVGHRLWLTKNDLKRGVRDGLYDEAQVDRLLDGAPAQPQVNSENTGGDDLSLSRVGLENADAIEGEDRPYEFWHVIWQYDDDDDGVNEDCLFVVEFSTGIIIRAEVYPFWHNRRCYVAYTPMPRKKSFFGFSVPEVLRSMHAEINAIRNQRVDAGTLANSPMMGAKRGVKFDANKQRWRPGGVVWLDDPKNDLVPISFQNAGQSAFAEEQSARENVEKALGISDYAMGSSPSRSRTVGEISQVSAAGNKRADALIFRLHLANNEIAAQVLGLNRQFLDPKTEYALTRNGEQLFQEFDLADLQTRVRIQAQGNTVSGNKELELQSAETLFQMMQHEPLMQTPTRRWTILADYLMARGKSDLAPYIGTEQEAQEQEAQSQNAPPPPPPVQMSGKLDEPATLAVALKEGQFTPQDYAQAAQMMMPAKVQQAQLDHLKNAADTEHQGVHDTAHALIQGAAQQAMTPPSAPALPPGGMPASPMPPQGA